MGRIAEPLEPEPSEVAEWHWVDPDDLRMGVLATPWAFSPWLVLQAEQLHALAGAS